jgi:predicted transposase YbfD/YdcC
MIYVFLHSVEKNFENQLHKFSNKWKMKNKNSYRLDVHIQQMPWN